MDRYTSTEGRGGLKRFNCGGWGPPISNIRSGASKALCKRLNKLILDRRVKIELNSITLWSKLAIIWFWLFWTCGMISMLPEVSNQTYKWRSLGLDSEELPMYVDRSTKGGFQYVESSSKKNRQVQFKDERLKWEEATSGLPNAM